jgi:hypothetical protein
MSSYLESGRVLSGQCPACWTSFLELGRIDRSKPLDNFVPDADEHFLPGTRLGPAGRIAVHVYPAGALAVIPRGVQSHPQSRA